MNAENKDKMTPYYYTIEAGYASMVAYLQSKGARMYDHEVGHRIEALRGALETKAFQAKVSLSKKLNLPASSTPDNVVIPPGDEEDLERAAVAGLLSAPDTTPSACATLLKKSAENGQQDIVELIFERVPEKITPAAMSHALLGAVENRHHATIA